VRAALISMAGQPRAAQSGTPISLAGKTVAMRQLEFALAAGCEQVVVMGDGAAPEAIALRHAAERSGARFQAIRNAHGLLGAIKAADELLVLAPGLVPEDTAALEMLRRGAGLLVLPGAAASAGFERIDLERAWAGALIVQGGAVERLAELPPEVEPAAALLRIALQSGMPERRMTGDMLAPGGWITLRDGEETATRERDWLRRNAARVPRWAVTSRLAQAAVKMQARPLLSTGRAEPALAAAALVLPGGAVTLAMLGWPAPALAVLALGRLASAGAAHLAALRRAPFGGLASRFTRLLPLLADAALAACLVFGIEGHWLHRVFAPLALLAALYACRPEHGESPAALLGDRGLLALLLAGGAAFGVLEPLTMAAALAVLVLKAAQSAVRSG
jgi:hypothetical protein